MLTIYKASAGSGKTFRLVAEYLKLILSNPNAYRHILAVTFTNKATAEMKERILLHLGKIARGDESPYIELFATEVGYPEPEIRERAGRALEKLLFDFNRFSISTIDKFTQRILKAFNREIGVNPRYRIETDSDLLVSEAVDRMIATMESRPGLQAWLESFIGEKIRNNRSFDVEKDLKVLGGELFKERFQGMIHLLSPFFGEKENSRAYLQMLNGVIYGFENSFQNKAKALVDCYVQKGYRAEDFNGKRLGVAGFLEKSALGDLPSAIGVKIRQAAEDAGAWAAKSSKRQQEIVTFAAACLQPGLALLLAFYDENISSYLTAKVIVNEWYTASVLVGLNEEVLALGREKEILPLAGSNLLLKTVIDGNDTPFIYEKCGNQYRYFMLDEFQDTSEMQWENFRPLIANSMADGFNNLVVGDVKQSIYRWRNSNWNILDRQVMNDFSGFPVRMKTLGTNYRSAREIIDFNNAFFGRLVKNMASFPKLASAPEDYVARFEEIYSDVQQKYHGEKNDLRGFVSVTQLDKGEEGFMAASLPLLVEQVKELSDHGFSARDIAILVRRKDQGVAVVNHFLEIAARPENRNYNLKVISGESLLLKSSVAVNFIITLFRHLTDREDQLIRATLLHLWKNYIDPCKNGDFPEGDIRETSPAEWIYREESAPDFDRELAPLVARVERLLSTSGTDEMITRMADIFGLFEMRRELPFLQSLTDKAAEVGKTVSGDTQVFLDWWDEKGQDVAVHVNEEVDAIRLLTIHKAKGLEFRAVLIPFFDWKLIDYSKKNILWCVPRESPFDQAPLVPVNFSDRLAGTIFSADYYRELFSLLVDNLNLVYVAFTRAVSVLCVNVPAINDKNRIGFFLGQALTELAALDDFGKSWDEGGGVFTFGEMPLFPVTHDQAIPESPGRWYFSDFSDRLRLRTGSDDFFAMAESGVSHKNLGKIVHSILAEIITSADLEPVCRKALAEGLLQQDELDKVVHHLNRMMRHPVAGDWFSGKYRVLTEADLLTSELTLRPDRIMILGDRAVVVDYKSGETRPDSHRRQVEQYAEILRNAGFREVTGYLWYIRENELVNTSLPGSG